MASEIEKAARVESHPSSFQPIHRSNTLPEHSHRFRSAVDGIPFAGRRGGNLQFVLDRNDPENARLLEKVPDAAPYITIRQSFDLRGFTRLTLWKAAVMEALGRSTKSALYLSS